MATITFNWDDGRCETLTHRCTQIMLGLMGLALMLMMMDMASIFILAPAGMAVLITRLAQRHYEQVMEEFEGSQATLTPRTLQLEQSATEETLRIRYKDIDSIESFSKWGIGAIRLNVREREPVEVHGFPAELATQLTTRLSGQCDQA